MPVVARNATQVLTWNAPMSDRNSPTKPLVPGKPTEASMNTMKHEGVFRHVVGEAAIARDLARVQPVIDDADAEEERGRDDAVAQHLDHRALQALGRHGEDAHGDEAHMRDRGIGDQLLHVLLRQRHQRGVDDGDDARA